MKVELNENISGRNTNYLRHFYLCVLSSLSFLMHDDDFQPASCFSFNLDELKIQEMSDSISVTSKIMVRY